MEGNVQPSFLGMAGVDLSTKSGARCPKIQGSESRSAERAPRAPPLHPRAGTLVPGKSRHQVPASASFDLPAFDEGEGVVVLGLGNLLCGDDGVGPRVAQSLSRLGPWQGVEVLDIGTPGLELTTYIGQASAVIVVDAVGSSAPPGTLERWGRDEILATHQRPRMSPHDVALADAILAVELVRGAAMEVEMVAVAVGETSLGAAMTPAVRGAIPRAVGLVTEILLARGIPVPGDVRVGRSASGRDDDAIQPHHRRTMGSGPGQPT